MRSCKIFLVELYKIRNGLNEKVDSSDTELCTKNAETTNLPRVYIVMVENKMKDVFK